MAEKPVRRKNGSPIALDCLWIGSISLLVGCLVIIHPASDLSSLGVPPSLMRDPRSGQCDQGTAVLFDSGNPTVLFLSSCKNACICKSVRRCDSQSLFRKKLFLQIHKQSSR